MASSNIILQTELASRLSTTPTTIQNWERKNDWDAFTGPFPEGKKEGKTKLYNWNACFQWYIKYVIFTEYSSLISDNADEDWKKVKEKEDALRTRADRQMKDLELAEAQGKLVPAADIEEKMTETVLTIRQKILTLTPRLTVLLSLDDNQKMAVDKLTKDVLRELAGIKEDE